jgi:hypothetical protein
MAGLVELHLHREQRSRARGASPCHRPRRCVHGRAEELARFLTSENGTWALSAIHLSEDSAPYLAPELTARDLCTWTCTASASSPVSWSPGSPLHCCSVDACDRADQLRQPPPARQGASPEPDRRPRPGSGHRTPRTQHVAAWRNASWRCISELVEQKPREFLFSQVRALLHFHVQTLDQPPLGESRLRKRH